MNNNINIQMFRQRNVQLIISIILQIIVYTIVSGGRFATAYNFQSMLAQLPESVLFSLGMMLVILTGGINQIGRAHV